jgi:hypothetical protein
VLDGKALLEAGASVQVTRSLPHGDIAAVHAAERQLGFSAILAPAAPSATGHMPSPRGAPECPERKEGPM